MLAARGLIGELVRATEAFYPCASSRGLLDEVARAAEALNPSFDGSGVAHQFFFDLWESFWATDALSPRFVVLGG